MLKTPGSDHAVLVLIESGFGKEDIGHEARVPSITMAVPGERA
jgi:hypothetical protein